MKISPEIKYIKNTELTHRKQYAQFFTPEIVAKFMISWITELHNLQDILDPAFGLGIFSRVLLTESETVDITGFEIDKCIYDEMLNNTVFKRDNFDIKNEDYLSKIVNKKFDGIICNPPYLKFHEYDNNNLVTSINKKLGLSLSKTSNLYVLFLLKSLSELREGGRLSYIVPSEFLNSNYGVAIKEYLVRSGMLRHIFIVNSELNVFDDATTTTAILFLENSKSNNKVSFYVIDRIEQLKRKYNKLEPYLTISNEELSSEKKWRNYYENENAKKYSNLIDFSEYARVRRGIATGANEYFSFNLSKAKRYSIPEKCLIPTITKSNQVIGNFFNNKILNQLIEQDKNVFLFDGLQDEDNDKVKEYLELGESEKINERYLTKKRKPWYRLEEREVAPILVGVFNRNGLKFIRNKSCAKNLTAYHCVYMKDSHLKDINLFFAYLITDVAKDIFNDHSRDYGKGLKKFEPNDLNKAKILDLTILSKNDKTEILKNLQCYEESGDEYYVSKIDSIFKEKYMKN